MLYLTNTLTGKKELFKPLDSDKVTFYTCGVTPYDTSHVGHGRVYVVFDTVYRLLDFLGYRVAYCRNITDIDDKILNKARTQLGDIQRYKEITDKYIGLFHDALKSLGCLPPAYEPRVTDNIPAIIAFIQELVDAGKAYVVDNDVYFSIAAFPEYGKLSKYKLDELLAGARVEVNEKKRAPLDFALWKGETDGVGWQSPWGFGRPGWHIECSVLAATYLGKHIDIHAGGSDLIFPHHENEIAQSEALFGAPFARYWLHNGMVKIGQEKMSKSLGNIVTLNDLFDLADPMIIRFYILSHHYRMPMEFSQHNIEALGKSYLRLCRSMEDVSCDAVTKKEVMESTIINKMLDALCDDLNTPEMFGILFDNLCAVRDDRTESACLLWFMRNVLGLSLAPIAEKCVAMTPEIEHLLCARDKARKERDWAKADALRDELKKLGYEVQDKKAK